MNKDLSDLHVTWISGMPRSGTTWLSQIFASSPDVRLKFCPLFSYEFKNALDENATPGEWRKLLQDVYRTESEYLDQEYLRKKGLVPHFGERSGEPEHLVVKSTRFHHLMPGLVQKLPEMRVLYVVRHPCATIHSWLSNPHEFPEGADAAVEWRTGACRKNGTGEFWGFDDWKQVTAQAVQLAQDYPEQVKLLRYEYLVANPRKEVHDIFAFFGIPYAQQTEDFLTASQTTHDANKRSVFKRPDMKDNWRANLPPEMVETMLAETREAGLQRFIEE